ncbi:MAG: hypothetical protein HOI23_04625 [Deltaproteobacteria bacterium]|jgi:hypothetical protein|nr:hypothetical protein [Deltaproteobacteria bacterium]MBT6433699.1 hypothetical protein [Deltaproteobacteria bacterium]MBT6489753.1 hypothetical protein [Deltaproteobacteria bacterium]
MTNQTSNKPYLMIALAAFSVFLIQSSAFAMGSINLNMQESAAEDRRAEEERRELGAETFINLGSGNIAKLNLDDTAVLEGSIYPNPGRVNVNLSIVHPDGTHVEEVTLKTNDEGEFKYETAELDAGSYAVSASWDGNEIYRGTSAELELPVQDTTGMFVILTSGSTQSSDQRKRAYATVGQYSANSLLARGIPMSRIQFLTPDYGTEVASPIATGLNTKENLTHAIEEWAPALAATRLSDRAKSPLTVIIIGDGIFGHIYTQVDEVISSGELASAIENFNVNATNLPAQDLSLANMFPVNIVLEAPKSGSFIDDLTGPKHYIFASTDSDNYPNAQSNMGQGGILSFTYVFMSQLASSQTLSQAFSTASTMITGYYADQLPELATDCDDVANEPSDQLAVSGIYLQTHASSNLKPQMLAVEAAQETSLPTATLNAVVVDPEGSTLNVSATIIPPTATPMSTFVQALSFTGSANTFSAEVTDLNVPGVYQVIYSATDNIGNISTVKTSTITVQ